MEFLFSWKSEIYYIFLSLWGKLINNQYIFCRVSLVEILKLKSRKYFEFNNDFYTMIYKFLANSLY